jgi:hypothetical protein
MSTMSKLASNGEMGLLFPTDFSYVSAYVPRFKVLTMSNDDDDGVQPVDLNEEEVQTGKWFVVTMSVYNACVAL